VYKYAPDGTLLWQRIFDPPGARETVGGIVVDPTDRIFVAGTTPGPSFGSPLGMNDGFVIQIDTGGTLVAAAQLGTTYGDSVFGVGLEGGGVIMTGTQIGLAMFWLDPVTGVNWTTTWPNAGSVTGKGLAVDGSGRVFVCGESSGGSGPPIASFGVSGAYVLRLERICP